MKSSVLVLIAENEPEIRLVLQVAFEDGGFGVLVVSSGEEAIAALDAKGETVRALLTDISLESQSSGWDVARHARELNPNLPVVYMTGGDGNDWAVFGGAERRFDYKAFCTGASVDRRFATS